MWQSSEAPRYLSCFYHFKRDEVSDFNFPHIQCRPGFSLQVIYNHSNLDTWLEHHVGQQLKRSQRTPRRDGWVCDCCNFTILSVWASPQGLNPSLHNQTWSSSLDQRWNILQETRSLVTFYQQTFRITMTWVTIYSNIKDQMFTKTAFAACCETSTL